MAVDTTAAKSLSTPPCGIASSVGLASKVENHGHESAATVCIQLLRMQRSVAIYNHGTKLFFRATVENVYFSDTTQATSGLYRHVTAKFYVSLVSAKVLQFSLAISAKENIC